MPIKTSSGKWKWGNVERSSKKELVQTVYGIWKKNGSKGSFSAFLKGTHESIVSEDTKRYAYHCTEVNPEKIKKEGWKVGKGFTEENQFEDLYKQYLPKVPVFISNEDAPVWDSNSKYCIKIDITGLDLYPDFGYLPDFNAYYDYAEECFYWEHEEDLDDNEKLKKYVLDNCENLTLYAADFSGEDSFNTLGTACVDGKKLKDRVVEWKENKNIKKNKEKQLTPKEANAKILEELKKVEVIDDSIDCPKNVTEISIPANIKKIEMQSDWQFLNNLKSIVIPGNVKMIDGSFITEAENLSSVVLEEGVEQLEWSCFFNNPNLKEITLPDSLKEMQEDCFSDCPKLKTVYCSEKIWNKYKKMFPKAVRKDKVTKESYEPPYSLDTIKQKYGDEVYRKLRDDPVHRFRAETGIEVIHKEPTRDEFERIVKNWDLMTPEQKKQSDEFSMKQFGKNNHDRIDNIRKFYMKKESVISEDKTSMIKKLVLPDIKDQKEKEDYKEKLTAFFKSHSNFENKIDWNKFNTLTKKDFDAVVASAETTKGAEKRKEKEEITSDIKNIFKPQKGREFFIAGENERWLFVAPLNYEAAVFCDSSENQGAGAKWCIGQKNSDVHWDNYINKGSTFVMAFNKNYKNLSEKDIKRKLKFMIQRDGDGYYYVWNQLDKNTGDDLSVFGKEKETADKMFDSVKSELKKIEKKFQTETNEKCEEILKNIKSIESDTFGKYKSYITKIEIPSSVTDIGNFAFSGCSGLKSIMIPSSVTDIGDYAFYDCSGLTSITIPSSVTSIGVQSFCHCSGLTSITIPSSVTNIGNLAFFYGCSNLKTIYCSKKIWNKFRNVFPESATRKDPPGKNESAEVEPKEALPVKESSEVDKFQEILSKPTHFNGKQDEVAFTDTFYYSKEHRFAWKIVFDKLHYKTSIHVFKPDIINVAGEKRFGWREYRVSDDHKQMQEIDLASFPTKDAATQAFKKLLQGR